MFERNFETRRSDRRYIGAMALGLALLIAATSAYAAGQNKEPWSGQKYDRAAMAVIMRNADSGSSASSNSIGASTTLVCGGGGGTSSATANSTCIIVNNGAADITAGQTSDGGQSASSSTSTTADQNSMSSALSGLTPGG
jgi:hypothetical protein